MEDAKFGSNFLHFDEIEPFNHSLPHTIGIALLVIVSSLPGLCALSLSSIMKGSSPIGLAAVALGFLSNTLADEPGPALEDFDLPFDADLPIDFDAGDIGFDFDPEIILISIHIDNRHCSY